MSRKKILVLDDDQVIVRGLQLKLEANGYEVLTAHDGATAIRLVRETAPDLLIFDVHFPVETNMHWDGFTVMEWLERLHQDWQKPLIIITGEEGKDYESRVKAVGAVAFFRKPVDYHELLAVIRGELEEETPAGDPAK